MIIFIIASGVCALGVRLVIHHAKLAALVAAVTSSALAQVVVTVQVGYFDPFSPFAFVGGAIIAWIPATIAIYFFDQWRKKPV